MIAQLFQNESWNLEATRMVVRNLPYKVDFAPHNLNNFWCNTQSPFATRDHRAQ